MKREQRKRPANMRPCMCVPPVCSDALKQQRAIVAKPRRSGWLGLDKSRNRKLEIQFYDNAVKRPDSAASTGRASHLRTSRAIGGDFRSISRGLCVRKEDLFVAQRDHRI